MCIYINLYVCVMHVYIYILGMSVLCIYVSMYALVYQYTHVYVLYVCMYVKIYMYTYICTT